MEMDDEVRSVVIATTDCERGLFIIAKDAMIYDKLEIHFTEKYAPTVEYLLRILRKAFGWMEIERGPKEVTNTKCKYNVNGYCTLTKNLQERGITKNKLHCTETIRSGCKHYTPKYTESMHVECVLIEKVGQIRNL